MGENGGFAVVGDDVGTSVGIDVSTNVGIMLMLLEFQ
jgi:hypothetical protein